MVPPETLDIVAQHLVELGMDPMLARQVLEGSLMEATQARDEQAQAPDHGQGQPPQGGEAGQGGEQSAEKQQPAA
jgi:hypothetical protein